ncbi:unnamed protein product [Citrullus colocynthis]|uniref:Alliinase C-terminal domain-containing protein n=1 Tax=Citrullus colocynthis TaxID=252529 RepID=A0ABP0XZP4_9ROSI
MFNFCTCVNFKQESCSDEEQHRNSLARKRDLKKSINETCNNPPLTLVSTSERRDYGEDRVINLDAGDPTMYETYWKKMGKKATVVIPGWRSMSYYSNGRSLCWFLEPDLCQQILRLHRVVGNAITEGRYIIVGTGSSQLILAALYALSPPDSSEPTDVVSAVPYYSSYPSMCDYLKTSLFKWGGDAHTYEKEGSYIEIVTSPNNPDGSLREPVVNRSGGAVLHDLAYYWPHYTPIAAPADFDLSLFTASKCTGHAGSRIGWALVKNPEIAMKMVKFIELNTIGVSKDSQLRTARMLSVISDSCEQAGSTSDNRSESFYGFGHRLMTERWCRIRQAVKHGGMFTLPDFPTAYCNFLNQPTETRPAFAWLKCEDEEEDCAGLLRRHKILGRSGVSFGCSPKFVRVSMMDRDDNFDLLVQRISKITAAPNSEH